MENLEDKYRKSRLTGNELQTLREQINSEDEDTTAQRMYEIWMSEEKYAQADASDLKDIKQKVNMKIGFKKTPVQYLNLCLRIAAVILIPVLLVSTIFLYNKVNTQLASKELTISTGIGEKAQMSLPDGTQVSLNGGTKIHYSADLFNKTARQITFEGEAYFNVAKNKKCPFIINTQYLKIEVVGTKFNLLARPHDKTAEIALDEGIVNLTSIRLKKQITLDPGYKATLDYETGQFTVAKDIMKQSSVWRHHQLIFTKTSLYNVINTLEKNYNVKISVDSDLSKEDLFTGTITSSNLNEALEILSKTYHLSVSYEKNRICLRQKTSM